MDAAAFYGTASVAPGNVTVPEIEIVVAVTEPTDDFVPSLVFESVYIPIRYPSASY